jgi:hypothetical protein
MMEGLKMFFRILISILKSMVRGPILDAVTETTVVAARDATTGMETSAT